ncbi:hypothetical protein BH09VER1_BH09VER1_43450 [soil metagenome]
MRPPFCRLSLLGFAVILLVEVACGEGDLSGLRITERSEVNGVTLLAESPFDTEYTVTIRCELINATASCSFPLTVSSKGHKAVELVRIQRKDGRVPWKYQFAYHWKFGEPSELKPGNAVYLLPFRAGEEHRVTQGHLGKFSHYQGTGNENAIDWDAAEGTPVCAARGGVVTGVRDDQRVGGIDPKLEPAANYVVIKHDDGTYAEYLHIRPTGALVRLGQKVTAGQEIARSGNTGFTDGPHLHFAVFLPVDGEQRVTLPVRFQTRLGVVADLKEGESY